MTKFINPLESESSTVDEKSSAPEQMESNSMDMNTANICPKCNNPMGHATIENGTEPVYWCEGGCRVSSPQPMD